MTALRIIIASALITAAAIKAVPALAEPAVGRDVTVSIVQTADLDLSTDAGRRALDQRLVVAAYEVCGTASDADLKGKNAARQCRSDVLAQARAKSDRLADRGKGTIVVAAQH
jgi:UrcA family protein